MTTETNKTVVRRYIEEVINGNQRGRDHHPTL